VHAAVEQTLQTMSWGRPITDEEVLHGWKERYELARDLMVQRDELMKQFLELPIAVQHSWEGYPVVDAALVSLEQGWFMNACLLSDAVFTDDRSAACINTRTNAIFSTPMLFKYQGEDEENEEDEEILEVKRGIRDLVKKYWDEMLPLDTAREWFRWGLFVNLGIGENIWDYHPIQMRFDSKYLADMDEVFLPIMKTWNPQNVYWRWDTRSFWLIHQSGQVELHPGDGRWVTYSPQGHNHGWLYGTIRQAAKLWLDRIFTYRDWARAEEKFALGIMLAKYPAGAAPEDKARFEDETTDMPPEATVGLPQLPGEQGGFGLEMLDTQQVGTGWEIFDRRADKLDRNIAILWLGQNLTTESQQSGSGTSSGSQRGNAKVQDSVRKDYLKADAKTIEHALKTQLIAPFVQFNFSAVAEELGISWRELIPEVTFQVEPPQEEASKAQAFSNVASGIAALAQSPIGPKVDWDKIGEQLDVPLITDERAIGMIQPGDSNERPRAPLLFPMADPDYRPTATSLSRGRNMHRHAGARAGQRYVDRVGVEAKQRAAELFAKEKDKILDVCRSKTTYREKQKALLELYRDASSGELKALMRHVLTNTHFAGRLAGKLDAPG
jgi:phage gp29-like protein